MSLMYIGLCRHSPSHLGFHINCRTNTEASMFLCSLIAKLQCPQIIWFRVEDTSSSKQPIANGCNSRYACMPIYHPANSSCSKIQFARAIFHSICLTHKRKRAFNVFRKKKTKLYAATAAVAAACSTKAFPGLLVF